MPKKTTKPKSKVAASQKTVQAAPSRSIFSRPFMITFIAIFCIIGGYLIYNASQAASYVELRIGGYCVDSSNIENCDSSNPNRVWEYMSGTFAIKSQAGDCLDDWNAASQNKPVSQGGIRAYVHYTTCYGDTNQKWHWDGSHIISNASSGCLNGLGGTTTPGTQLGVYACNSGSNENFSQSSVNVGGSTPPATSTPKSTPPPTTSSYRDPFRNVPDLTFERVDQGVDFGGSGPVYAIGDGVIDYIYAPAGSGWGSRNIFVKYRFSDGSKSGQYVYVAEDCSPTVSMGQRVNSGTVICDMYNGGSGIETGWAQASGDLPLTQGGGATSGGYSFQSFLESLDVHM